MKVVRRSKGSSPNTRAMDWSREGWLEKDKILGLEVPKMGL